MAQEPARAALPRTLIARQAAAGTGGQRLPALDEDERRALLAGLPRRPGVYQMIGADDEVLYVGKARSLRARVTAYFRASGLTTKTMAMVAKLRHVQITVTGSETEALLLEQSLIKAQRPRFNVVLRDDKSYPYIHLTEHPFPRLTFHRGAKRKGRYFGPYPSAAAVRDSLNILQKLFGIRPCEDGFFKNRTRPCLQHQINRCSAPCVGLVDRDRYADDVRLATLFLDGRSGAVLSEFKQRMDAAAEQLEFERAARYRDQITHLRKVQENQYVHGARGDVDVFGIAAASGMASVHGLFVRDGRLLGHRTWFPGNELAVAPEELLFAFLCQYYFGGSERDVPKSVVVAVPDEARKGGRQLSEESAASADAAETADQARGEPLPPAPTQAATAEQSECDWALLASALGARAGRKIEVAQRVRGQRARWAAMAAENAALSLRTLLADRKSMMARFIDLQAALGWEDLPRRLECFDISHASGEATVASCVVFDTAGPVKSDYRRFNIEGVPRGDDYGAMEQAIRRRYTRLAAGDGVLPDALVIDGGDGQVGRARDVLEQLQVDTVALIGIAKGPTRKAGLETVVVAGQGEVALPPDGAAMHLLQHIRDEAHRFAISGHRGQRQKQRRRSVLDDIAGVGPTRKRQLLAHFGAVASLRGASVEEIAKVPGISRKLAADIHASLHGAMP